MGLVEIAPQRVFVETHLGCSYRCRHCYQVGDGLVRNRSLPLDEALRRIELIRDIDGVQNVVPVTGEVLEHLTYLSCYRAAGWTEYLVSNGLRLVSEPEVGALVAACGFRRLRISAHYFAPKFFLPCGQGCVSSVVRAVGKHGLAVEAFNVVGSFNYQRIADMVECAANDGLVELRLINFVPTSSEYSPLALTPSQIDEVFEQVATIRASSGASAPRLRMLGNFGPRPGSALGERLAAENRYCPAGRDSVYVTTDGQVYGCHFMLRLSTPLGRLVDGRIMVEENRLNFDRRTCPLVCGNIV